MTDHLKQMERRQADWQARRQEELSAPDSWLGLIALIWLEPGSNSVGSSPDCTVVLPKGPPLLGHLAVAGTVVTWMPAEGTAEALSLSTDHEGEPSVVTWGDLAFFVIEREGRLAVRLRDRGWASRQPFAGLEYFPFAREWRVAADWLPLDPPQTMEVPNVTGELKRVRVDWQAVFDYDGHEVTLLPMTVAEDHVFFIFRDGTSGRESYGAGRFLRARPAEEGRIVLDFNRAYNPPCAFTPFATCPLPPPENWLPFPIRAGEKKYKGHA